MNVQSTFKTFREDLKVLFREAIVSEVIEGNIRTG